MSLCMGTGIPLTVCVGHFLPLVPLIFDLSKHRLRASSNFFPFGLLERWVQPPAEFLPSRRSGSRILSPMQPPHVPLCLLHAFFNESH
ncbi:hypothetical protein ES332_A10G175400v1 [Gossypium tomentosum]|uniref:Uncharacterized protein n=1 Tax=Gossypium tomentosum TaxID=34277 RepID=A0A5D2NT18_GOSTO|nr:hypothetical protein ES332_A10G175400v1 [Gossypium tomentosum]